MDHLWLDKAIMWLVQAGICKNEQALKAIQQTTTFPTYVWCLGITYFVESSIILTSRGDFWMHDSCIFQNGSLPSQRQKAWILLRKSVVWGVMKIYITNILLNKLGNSCNQLGIILALFLCLLNFTAGTRAVGIFCLSISLANGKSFWVYLIKSFRCRFYLRIKRLLRLMISNKFESKFEYYSFKLLPYLEGVNKLIPFFAVRVVL